MKHNPLLFWQKCSIRIKVTVAQCVLIVLPLCLCVTLIFQTLTTESRSDNAGAMYSHNSSIVAALDTSIRQLESLANTLAASATVKAYVSEADEEARESLYAGSILNLFNYSFNRYLPTRDIELLPRTTLEELGLSDEIIHYRGNERAWTFSVRDGSVVARYYYQFRGNDGQTGVMIFTPGTMLQDTLTSIRTLGNQSCAICTQDGNPILTDEADDEAAFAMLGSFSLSANEGYTVLDGDYVGYCVNSEILPFRFVSVQRLSGSMHLGKLLPLLLLSVVIVVICVFISYQTLYKGITNRILSLSGACKAITARLDATETPASDTRSPARLKKLSVPVTGLDEIGTLSESINEMLSHIMQLTAINEHEVMISQKSAYDMLAAQIHPHFIYNTLENLRMMAETNDDTQVADMLYALGRMLHLSISDASSTGELSMEIEHVQTYLQLQKMRMNDMIDYDIVMDDERIVHEKCPRFLLQPVVENAIKHGFAGRKTAGHIKITSGRCDMGIVLCVEDDGNGMTPERLIVVRNALKNKTQIPDTRGGIGLANVLSRLRMFYGRDAAVSLESEPGKGTRCTLLLPIYSPNRPAPIADGTPPA